MYMGIAYCERTVCVDNLFKGMTPDLLVERLSMNDDEHRGGPDEQDWHGFPILLRCVVF
jgi:hypothetical protein